ncbi:hypothetical protein I302_100895 [Kwoniella bestiolae CBS 10118]|uniref:Phospholipid-transporting ATPase n=1 Tax=Kwoniella bestiolae CBS 10118 TaxID=1296100 RepID=A0A1B9G6G0_9TREE|nr:phospholipid-translocating ATPase [Kwoniella bestiolae CBS 10118]OCF26583.1 phospholipid-translocating ATPase [Kwoniella bestiolae CBS 10118]
MAATSTSKTPLVPRSKKHQPSWYRRNIARPLSKLNPSKLFHPGKQSLSSRSIYINEELPSEFYDKKGKLLKNKKYPTNQNVTSKYTIITFLPRNLFEQFRRVANIFFAAINILQFFPKFSTISPGLVILPLIVVLAITAIKDGYEDIKRHQADHKVNHSIVHVLGGEGYENMNPMKSKEKTFIPAIPLPKLKSRKAKKAALLEQQERENGQANEAPPAAEPRGQDHNLSRMRSQVSNWQDDPEAGDSPNEIGWHRTIWEDVRVGDIVKIYDGDQFPADILICSTSEEEDVAYIETKNLDGETNLKSRNGVPGLSHLDSARACTQAHLRIDLDAPEVNMFRLNGAVVNLEEVDEEGQHPIHPVTLETTLLRGCVLKNTAWVIGVVIFTGADTKIIQNAGRTPSKRSKVERQMNPQVLLNLFILALIAMVCAIVDYFNEVRWNNEQAYWMLYADTSGDNPSINGLVTFANAFITFQNIVPISLYISIEAVRTIQAAYIYWDRNIKYIKNGVVTRTTARSWNLSDDLGQIQYVFSDKTGTLTQNAMIFRQCSIGGRIYTGDGQPPSHPTLTHIHSDPHQIPKASSGSSDSEETARNGDEKGDDVKVVLPKEVLAPFHDAELDKDLAAHDTEQSRVLHGFFAVLGLCHTVLAAEPEPGVIEYKAQSPDEAALVQSAADVGFVFRGRDHNILKMSTPFSDQPDEYELLHVLEFNSARKRMSVILRKLDEDGRIFLLTKGADNIIFERLSKDNTQKELKQKTDQDLQYFASEGLRTLCLAYRVLGDQEYETWAKDYHNATVSLEDREGQVEAVSSRIEQDLILLGATAIEDKLQDGVPETITDLKRAGIKVWVATGDKLETAVAIGYTTNLLTQDTNLIVVREGRHSIQDQIRDALEGFFGEHEVTRTISGVSSRSRPSHEAPNLARINTGVQSLVGRDNGTRPGGFSLVIDGHALAHCFEDDETESLLLALSTQCNTVICCRVSPLQKAQIVHLIKDNLGVMCLAIGDGANDVSMIQAADVGVGISGEEGLQAVNSSDYAIAQFRYLKRLLFVHGHWSYYRNSSMILNFFYKNIIGIGVLFWYMIFCGWSTTYVFAYIYLLFWNVFWTIMPVLAIGLFDKDIDDETLMALPELYRKGREGRYFGIKIFLYYLFEGFYQTAVIYFFIHYTYVSTTTRGDGYDIYIYEMSTTMVIGAVMVANLFTGLNIDSWTGWTYFGILFGPVLIWLFTAIYSIIPPSSFYTGVYGNDVFLFRSAAFWFGWPFVFVIALLPRYIIRYLDQNAFGDDIAKMRLVRKYHPDVNPETHPLLGGKLGEKDEKDDNEDVDQNRDDIRMQRINSSNGNGGQQDSPLSRYEELESGTAQPAAQQGRPSYERNPRSSFQSGRFGMHSQGRGSAVDMSTGLSQEPSRGYGFTMEEGGVAIQRMQSRLSQHSHHSNRYRFIPRMGGSTSGTNKEPFQTAPIQKGGMAKIRERAGSILSRKRAGTDATHHSGSGGVAESPTKSGGFLSPGGGSGGSGSSPLKKKQSTRQWESRGPEDQDEGEEEELGRDLGSGQNMAPPEIPRV